MFNFLENELHVIKVIGSCLETLEKLYQRKRCRFKMLFDEECQTEEEAL